MLLVKSLQISNGVVHKVNFDRREGVSQPDVDSEDTDRVEALSLLAAYLYTLKRELNISSFMTVQQSSLTCHN